MNPPSENFETAPFPRLRLSSPGEYRIHAPAKLNFLLHVFPIRPDGFHPLESWFVPLAWYDTIFIRPDARLALEVQGPFTGIPTQVHENLVGRAVCLLAERAGREARGTVALHKVIPPGGGLGGGSSDAAAVLVGLNEIWQLHWSAEQLCDLAAKLGSDVPFFVVGKSAICRGRGEHVTPLPFSHPLHAVLLLPPAGISTRAVYEEFDRRGASEQAAPDVAALAALPAPELNDKLYNHLQGPAFALAPWLAALARDAAAVAGQKIHMTGSGSTLFTICESYQQSAVLGARLEAVLGARCAVLTCRVDR